MKLAIGLAVVSTVFLGCAPPSEVETEQAAAVAQPEEQEQAEEPEEVHWGYEG